MDTDTADFLLGGETKSIDLLVRIGLTAVIRNTEFYRDENVEVVHKIGMKAMREACSGNLPRGASDDFMAYLKPAYEKYQKRRFMRNSIENRMIVAQMSPARLRLAANHVLRAARRMGYHGKISVTTMFFAKPDLIGPLPDLHPNKPTIPLMRGWWDYVLARGNNYYKNRLILAKIPIRMDRWVIFVLDRQRPRGTYTRLVIRRHIVEGRPKWL